MGDSSTQGSEEPDGGALPLRGGITAFVVISVVGYAAYRAIQYFLQTHGAHPVPFDSTDAFSAYAPAAGVLIAAVAALAIHLIVKRRRSSRP